MPSSDHIKERNRRNLKAQRQRWLDAGLKQLGIVAHIDDHEAIKVFARDLEAKREGWRVITEHELSNPLAVRFRKMRQNR